MTCHVRRALLGRGNLTDCKICTTPPTPLSAPSHLLQHPKESMVLSSRMVPFHCVYAILPRICKFLPIIVECLPIIYLKLTILIINHINRIQKMSVYTLPTEYRLLPQATLPAALAKLTLASLQTSGLRFRHPWVARIHPLQRVHWGLS